MVFGIEAKPAGDLTSREVAVEIVKAAYLGAGGDDAQGSGDGIHLLGPLAGHVIRVSPPMTITTEQTRASLELLYEVTAALAEKTAADACGGRGLEPIRKLGGVCSVIRQCTGGAQASGVFG